MYFSTCYYIKKWVFTKYILIYFITFVSSVCLTPGFNYAELKRYDDLPKQTWSIPDPGRSARVILVPLFSRFGPILRTSRPILSQCNPIVRSLDPLTIPLSFFRESKAVLDLTIIVFDDTFCCFYLADFMAEVILTKNWVTHECFTRIEYGLSKLAGIGSPLRHVNKRISVIRDCERTFSLTFLLLSCSDISLNSGPIKYKYPCGICGKAVRKNQNGIYCDGCNLWHHLKCLDMNIETFNEHAQKNWSGLVLSKMHFSAILRLVFFFFFFFFLYVQ